MRPACYSGVPGETLLPSLLFLSQALDAPHPSSGDPNPPHWGLGSAGDVQSLPPWAVGRPGPSARKWRGPGIGAPQERPSGQNHRPSEDGVLGAASLPAPLTGVHTLWQVCTLTFLCVCTHWTLGVCPVTAPTRAVPVVCPEPKLWVGRL